jgi:hypothetical protein
MHQTIPTTKARNIITEENLNFHAVQYTPAASAIYEQKLNPETEAIYIFVESRQNT